MPNLGVLQIIYPDCNAGSANLCIRDGTIRGWADVDSGAKPSPLLRVLRIWGSEGLTPHSIQWFSQFPSLSGVDVIGTYEDIVWVLHITENEKRPFHVTFPMFQEDIRLGNLKKC